MTSGRTRRESRVHVEPLLLKLADRAKLASHVTVAGHGQLGAIAAAVPGHAREESELPERHHCE